jgi:hypothetical protein
VRERVKHLMKKARLFKPRKAVGKLFHCFNIRGEVNVLLNMKFVFKLTVYNCYKFQEIVKSSW